MKNDVQTGPSTDLGGFAPDSFEKVNAGTCSFTGSQERAVGSSGIPTPGERSADAAIGKVGGLRGTGRSDATKGPTHVTLPTEAGGPLPQDGLHRS